MASRASTYASSKCLLLLSAAQVGRVTQTASACSSCCNESTTDRTAEITKMCCLPALDAGSLRSRYWQGWLLLWAVFHVSLSFSSCFRRSCGSLPYPLPSSSRDMLPAGVSVSKFPFSEGLQLYWKRSSVMAAF